MRQSGVTTAQMLKAPLMAIYVCPGVRSIPYHKRLTHHIGRSDLTLVTPDTFETLVRASRRPIVVDHAVEQLGTMQLDLIDALNSRLAQQEPRP
jgi:hypothetical protein